MPSITLVRNNKTTLSALGHTFTWTNSDPSVATVNYGGDGASAVITGVSPGKTTIVIKNPTNQALIGTWEINVIPTQTDCGTWISEIAKGPAIDFGDDKTTECVDLIKHYLKELFKVTPGQLGHGPVTYQGVVKNHPKLFTQIEATNGTMPLQSPLEVGDIVSMKGNEGHVALVKSLTPSIVFADQYNGSDGVLDTTYTATSTSSKYFYLYGVARPKFNN